MSISVEEAIRILEEYSPKKLRSLQLRGSSRHKKAEDLCRELYLIFNGRCSADVLCDVNRLSRKEDKVEYLKSFGNYLLTLADSCDEYTKIKEELNNKRATEQSLKDKLGIK